MRDAINFVIYILRHRVNPSIDMLTRAFQTVAKWAIFPRRDTNLFGMEFRNASSVWMSVL